jgi:hypothetical protein
MSNNTKIFSEAIAEAKAIRETAMANAKLALEEAFAPRIQEMMSDKLEALAEEEETERTSDLYGVLAPYGTEEEIDAYVEKVRNNPDYHGRYVDDMIEDFKYFIQDKMDSALEEEEVPENPEDYRKNLVTEEDEELDLEELLSELESLEENAIFEAEDEDEVGEITVDELKDIIRDIMADVMAGEGAEEEESEEEGEGEEGEEMASEDDLELEEILAEIEALGEEKSSDDESSMKYEAKEKELEEAMNTIATLRSELNEVNLLNAKLLYVNKLFKAKNLNESQKVKVINAFDRAETVREAKNVYDTLNESLSTEKAKSQIKESLSFASKPAGMAPNRQPIVENDDFVKRMQKIAGII